MSFASPAWLAALALVPLALTAYLYAQRRVRRYAIRFPAMSTLRTAAAEGGAGAAWARHLPAALVLAAIAALALALARPRTTYQAAINQASIVLVTDHSGSMSASDVQPSRLAAAEMAANQFIDKLPGAVRLGAVAFSSSADAVQGPVTNHGAARQLVDSQQAGGSTATGDALALALTLLHASNSKHPPSAVVLLSDGAANAGQSPVSVARQAAQDRIPIYTVALGTPNGTVNVGPFSQPIAVPPDPQLMQQIAEASGGRAFNAQSADQLSSIYNHLGAQLGSVTRRREVTTAFAIAGLVLLLGAAGIAARFAGRLP
jgi:Ca-activated chloride channel family protein